MQSSGKSIKRNKYKRFFPIQGSKGSTKDINHSSLTSDQIMQPDEKVKKVIAQAFSLVTGGKIPVAWRPRKVKVIPHREWLHWSLPQRCAYKFLWSRSNKYKLIKIALHGKFSPWIKPELWRKMDGMARRLHKNTKPRQWALHELIIKKNNYKPLNYPIKKARVIAKKTLLKMGRRSKRRFKRKLKIRLRARRKIWARFEIQRRKKLGAVGALLKSRRLRDAKYLSVAWNNKLYWKLEWFLKKKDAVSDDACSVVREVRSNTAPHFRYKNQQAVVMSYTLHKKSSVENSFIKLYVALCTRAKLKVPFPQVKYFTVDTSKKAELSLVKKQYLKHVVRLRYRWVYRPNLKQFKLFRKFFKRVAKRYRKISKNKLFALKLHEHFSKLTGYSEKGLFQIWAPIRRSYNNYGGYNNALQCFGQSLLLMPASLLTFLNFTPSRAAAKQLIKAGVIFVNGLAATLSKSLVPGDIFQINSFAWKKAISLFSYQRWNYNLLSLQQLSFIQADYAAMMFMLFRWPRVHELIAPSFLTERWLRYYIRRFPVKSREFKARSGNWKVYKQLPRR